MCCPKLFQFELLQSFHIRQVSPNQTRHLLFSISQLDFNTPNRNHSVWWIGNSYASRCCCHRPRCVYAANSEWTLIVIIIPQTYIYIEKMTVQMWFFPLCINYNWNFTILFHFWRDHNFFNWTSGGPTTAAMEFPSKSVCLAIIISCRWRDHLRHSLPALSGFRVHLILHLQSRMKLFASPLEWIPLFTYSFSLATKSLKCIGNYEYMRCYPPYDRDNSNREWM